MHEPTRWHDPPTVLINPGGKLVYQFGQGTLIVSISGLEMHSIVEFTPVCHRTSASGSHLSLV